MSDSRKGGSGRGGRGPRPGPKTARPPRSRPTEPKYKRRGRTGPGRKVKPPPAPTEQPVAEEKPKRTEPRPPPPSKRQPPSTRRPEGPPRAGFALLVGRPNVGKSTLLNELVGEHLAAVSNKPQTTRHRILGVVNRPGTQVGLLDTPGVHKGKGLLGQVMAEAVTSALDEVDVILYLAEAGWPQREKVVARPTDPVGPSHRSLLTQLEKADRPVILVLTKIDLIPKPLLLPAMEAWGKAFPFAAIYPVSGLTGENVEGLIEVVREHLPEGPPLFPPDTLTDQPEKLLCAEFIREQVFRLTHAEIPYGTAVVIDSFDESERPAGESEGDVEEEIQREVAALAQAEADDAFEETEEEELEEASEEGEVDGEESTEEAGVEAEPELGPGLVRISASVIVERDSHKGIVIGKGGERLKTIGTAARLRMERLFGCRVWLELHVRVIPGWSERRAFLAEMGYIPD